MKNISEILKIGDKFNDFIVIDVIPIIIDRRQQIRVKCNCGKEIYIRPDRLMSGQTKSCFQCAGIKKRGKATVFVGDLCSKVFLDIRSNARQRNLPFDLSMKFLWELYQKQKGKCVLSGIDINLKLLKFNGIRSREEVTASLDRIDSTKGYVENNVQWVHKWINVMKGAMSDQYFLYLCNTVAKHNNFKYDNIEPSLMKGWLPRMSNKRQFRSSNQEGATTSFLSNQSNNKNQERPTPNYG